MSAGWIKLVLTAASCLDKLLHKSALSVLLSCHKSSHIPLSLSPGIEALLDWYK